MFQSEIDLYKLDIEVHIKKIDLGKAKNFTNTISGEYPPERFYECSGLYHLIKSILEILDKKKFPLEAIFIENSTITTATEEDMLSAFTAFWHKENNLPLAQHIFKTQESVIKYLQHIELNIFWHKDFFIAPQKSLAFLSGYKNEKKKEMTEANKIIIEYEKWLNENFLISNEFNIGSVSDNEKDVFVYNSRFEMEYSDVINKKSTRVSNKKEFSLLDLHTINHKLYHHHFFPDLNDSQETIYLSIPMLCPYASGIESIDNLDDNGCGKFAGLGAVFILMLFEKDINMDAPDLHTEVLPLLVDNIFLQAKDFASFYSYSAAYRKAVELKKQAIKAAIAQVMSRNLSHNIGSHVLPEYRTYFKKFFGDYIAADYDSGRKNTALSEGDADTRLKNLNSFFNYTQSRMELTADISISQDKRIPFNYSLEDIKNEFGNFKSNLLPGLFDSLNKPDAREIRISFKNEKGKYAFIPGGQLGKSALYLIIENVLRNYYKHSNREVKEEYEFVLYINEPEEKSGLQNDYWCVDFYDCHGMENIEKRRKTIGPKNAVLSTIQDYIDAPVLDASKKTLRSGGWGFIEMKAACAFLINYPIPELDTEPNINLFDTKFPPKLLETGYYQLENKIPVGRWTKDDGNSKELNLGFRFYLKKAKVLLIDNDLLSELNENQKASLKQWRSEGIEHEDINRPFKRTEHEILLTNKEVGININQRLVDYRPLEIKSSKELLQNAWSAYITQKIEKRPPQFLLNNDEEPIEGKYRIIIDDHGVNFKINGEKPTFRDLQQLSPENAYFLQNKAVPSFPEEVFSINLTGKEKILEPLRIIETAKIRVSIFDERIQKDTRHKIADLPDLTLRDVHELGGVFIPCINNEENPASSISFIDLDATSDQNVVAFWDMVEKRLGKGNDTPDDYVIVHYTLFEKACPPDKSLEKFFESFPDDWKHRLLFCSGRGRPSNLVQGCMYINLSTLQDALVTKPSKFALVNILKSL